MAKSKDSIISDMEACEKFQDKFQAYIDGHLGPVEKMRLEFHLSICDRCSEKLDDLIETKIDSGEIELLESPIHER